MRWNFPTAMLPAVKRAGARYGIQAALVLSGAVVAIGGAFHPVESSAGGLAGAVGQPAAYLSGPKAPPRPFESKASSTAGPKRTSALNLDFSHSRIDQWVRRLTSSDDFKSSLDRMDKYDNMIFAKLDAKRMPRDLIYLAMIESNFNPKAKSPVRAVGLWQFMSATARQFGLKVRGKVDERKNPSRSTDAALAYLSTLHDRFGSWYLAAAAYNSGEGTVSRALKRVTGKSRGTDADFFRILPRLPRETQDYVPKLIAAARIGNAPDRYGLD